MRPAVGLVLTLFAGCQAFNDECTALVPDRDALVVTIANGEDVYLDRPNARLDNNAIGQAAADAFREAMDADFGVLNSGSLRSEGLCGVTRNIVRGNITDQVLHEILLFENIIGAVDMTGKDVKDMFEHSVEQVFPAGATIVSPSGQFLQVSKEVKLAVDCTRPVGNRITSVTLKGVLVTTFDTTKTYRVAISSFLLNGGDGYVLPMTNFTQAGKLGGVDSNIASDYMKRTFRGTTLTKEARIDMPMTFCARPVKPASP